MTVTKYVIVSLEISIVLEAIRLGRSLSRALPRLARLFEFHMPEAPKIQAHDMFEYQQQLMTTICSPSQTLPNLPKITGMQ